MYQASVEAGLNFLQELLDSGKGYSVINTARSALSAILILKGGGVFGQHPDVKTFMRGVYNTCPPMPRYTQVWDVSVVLELLRRWSPARRLPLEKLTKKLVVLMLLVSGQRIQFFKGVRTDAMEVTPGKVVFTITNEFLKQGRLGYKLDPVVFAKYVPDRRLCVHNYLVVYLERTLDNRGMHKQVVLTTKKPYGPASSSTISRWVKEVLQEAGVNMSVYKPGSIRHATTSRAKSLGVPVDEIMAAGGWSSSRVFATYYHKRVEVTRKFADKVLQS